MNSKKKSEFNLPLSYSENLSNEYFFDKHLDGQTVVHQPEVYWFADYILRKAGRNTLVDVGCGSGRKLARIGDPNTEKYGLDFGSNVEAFSRDYPQSVPISVDLETASFADMPKVNWANSVVICADVIEHLKSPHALVQLLKALSDRGAILVVSTPDREKVHLGPHAGPPVNPAHVREWTLSELEGFFDQKGLKAAFAGYSISDNFLRARATSVLVFDTGISFAVEALEQRPLGIVSCYNDADILEQLSRRHLEQGIDLYFLDNWSTDGTYEIIEELAGQFPGRISMERIPEDGPTNEYLWVEILDRKAEIAAQFPKRWILHIDSDELRLSPWGDVSLAKAFAIAEKYGSNIVDFCVAEFPPTRDGFDAQDDPIAFFDHFYFSSLPAHFFQKRAWLQGEVKVDLSSSGGHEAKFARSLVFPYRFMLCHYPIRSVEQGRSKIFRDRLPRFSVREKDGRGWHTHYNHINADRRLLQPADLYSHFHFEAVFQEYPFEIISNIVLRRRDGSLLFP